MTIIRLAIFLIVSSGSTTCSLDHSHQVSFGHMEPLGSHRPPETTLVDDLQEMPSPREFWTNYVRPSRAVVLRGAAKHSRAFTEWTDGYLREHFSDLEVRLEAKKEKSSFVPIGSKGVGRDTIGNFIDHCHKDDNNLYIVSELPSPMWPDVTVIPPMTCGLLKDRLVEVDLWMSGGGTSSILHKDAFNAINCLYNGTKEWKLIEYKYEDMIYKAWEPPEMVGGFSRINVQKVDLLKYPKVAEVPWSFVTVNAGDCLFLPKSYYHQVTSYGTNNVAVSLLFSRLDGVNDIHFRGCDQPLSHQPLSEFDVDWKYSGHGNLSMGNTDLESIRNGLLELFGEEEKLDKAGLQKNLKELLEQPLVKGVYSYATQVKDMEHIEKIFEWFGVREEGFVSREEIKNLSRDEMRKFALAFEGTDVSNTEEAEYGIVNPDYLRSLLKYLIESDGHIEENKFIKAYMEGAGGTRTYAKNFFEKLRDVTSAPGKVTSEELKRNLDRALERYLLWAPEPDIPPGQDSPEPNDAYIENAQSGEEEDDTDRTRATEEAKKEEEGFKHEEL